MRIQYSFQGSHGDVPKCQPQQEKINTNQQKIGCTTTPQSQQGSAAFYFLKCRVFMTMISKNE
jgi:hypothetical protein